MSSFGSSLASHLAKKLNLPIEDITEALESFGGGTVSGGSSSEKKASSTQKKSTIPPKKQTTTIVPPPKKQAKNDDTKLAEKHTCERIKKGQSEKCGKNAMRCVDDGNKKHWYCGTEKAGCYLSELNIKAKKDSDKESVSVNNKSTGSKKSSSAPKTNVDRKVLSDNKSKSLVQTVLKQLDVLPKTVNGKKLHMEKTSRALIDPQTREFYGMLDEDNLTILPLDDKTIKFIESGGHTIRQEKTLKTVHKQRETHGAAKKVPTPEAFVESEESEESSTITRKEEPEISDDDLEISDDDLEISDDDLEISDDDK